MRLDLLKKIIEVGVDKDGCATICNKIIKKYPEILEYKIKQRGTDIKFDYGVTDELWEQVVPKEYKRSVVCLPCLDKLAHEKNIELGPNIEFIQFTGINTTIEFLPCNVFNY